MVILKRKRSSLFEKYKAITVMESKKPSKLAKNCGFTRNAISTWLLSGNKEKIKVLFNVVRLAQKGKT